MGRDREADRTASALLVVGGGGAAAAGPAPRCGRPLAEPCPARRGGRHRGGRPRDAHAQVVRSPGPALRRRHRAVRCAAGSSPVPCRRDRTTAVQRRGDGGLRLVRRAGRARGDAPVRLRLRRLGPCRRHHRGSRRAEPAAARTSGEVGCASAADAALPGGGGAPSRFPGRRRGAGPRGTTGRGAGGPVDQPPPHRGGGRRDRLHLRPGRLPPPVCRVGRSRGDLGLPGAGPHGRCRGRGRAGRPARDRGTRHPGEQPSRHPDPHRRRDRGADGGVQAGRGLLRRPGQGQPGGC